MPLFVRQDRKRLLFCRNSLLELFMFYDYREDESEVERRKKDAKLTPETNNRIVSSDVGV